MRKILKINDSCLSFLERALIGVCVIKNDLIVFSNKELAKILELKRNDFLNKNIFDYIIESDISKIKAKLDDFENGKDINTRFDARFKTINDNIIWLEIAISKVIYDGERCNIAYLLDVTDKKTTEKEYQELSKIMREQEDQLVHSTRLAELGEMAAAVAHELNQPLTGIRNFAKNTKYMIENDAGSEDDIKTNLQMISDQVDRAARIINQMRELTRRSDILVADLNVNNIINESTKFLMAQFNLTGIQIEYELSDNLPLVRGDRIRLEQVFLNILTNARQAMEEEKERKLYIKTFYKEDKKLVIIEVQDTGKGFDEKDKNNLFKPFYSTKSPGKGTGLGLSISYRIIKDHDGIIDATSRKGEGARFIISIPCLNIG